MAQGKEGEEMGVEIDEEPSKSADTFNKLKVRKDQIPIRPLRGKTRMIDIYVTNKW